MNMVIPFTVRIHLSLSNFLSVTLAYGLMLCVMSYNTGIFIAAIFGLSIGHFIFSYLKLKSKMQLDYYTRDYTNPY
jgi:hypothetical protein